jgi:hypothetical protein
MNYGELRTYFKDLLNRSDCSDAQADTFLGMGLRRTERNLRTALQRQTATIPVTLLNASLMAIPNDYIGMHTLKVDGVSIRRGTDTEAQPDLPGLPEGYFISGPNLNFRPSLSVGSVVTLTYYSEFTDATDSASITLFSQILPDLIIYGSLPFACDFFLDVRKDSFDATFGTMVNEVQSMSDRDDMTGGMTVANPYAGMC